MGNAESGGQFKLIVQDRNADVVNVTQIILYRSYQLIIVVVFLVLRII